MVKGDPTTVFLVALTKKGSGSNDSKARAVSPFHRVQMLVIISYGLMVVPGFLFCFVFLFVCLVSTPKSFLSPSYTKKEKKESDN